MEKKKNSRKHIIVNADDYGMSSFVNKAILKSMELGLISSTTIISNMSGFEEACQLAHERKIIHRVGVHLNLTDGKPLTKKINNFSKYCNGLGNFCFKPSKGHILNREEKEAVYEELKAQIKKCMHKGLKPTHIDSHHHFHNYWTLGKLVIKIAKQFHIPAVRLAFNWGNRISLKRKIYARLFNNKLRLCGLAKTNFFCEILDVTPNLLNRNSPIEIMVHPRLNENGLITNYDNGQNLENLIKHFLLNESFCSYYSLTAS